MHTVVKLKLLKPTSWADNKAVVNSGGSKPGVKSSLDFPIIPDAFPLKTAL